MDHEETRRKNADWINLALSKIQMRSFVKKNGIKLLGFVKGAGGGGFNDMLKDY